MTNAIWQIVKIGFPAFVCQFLAIFQESINLFFVGKLNDLSLINAIGLGNVMMNVLGYATIFGLNGALATFVSQMVGAKEYEICGVLRWRARYIVMSAFLLILPIFIFGDKIFLMLKMEETTSKSAGNYLLSQLPAMFILGYLDIDRNFLACFGRTDISMYCQILSPFIHVTFCYTFIIKLNMGVTGCGAAMTCTNLIIYILQNIMMKSNVLEA